MHDLRTQLISEGVIRPAGTFEPPRYEHPEPVLRLDDAGRNAVHRPYDEDQNREVAEAVARMRRGRADGTIPGTPLGSAPVVLAHGSADGTVAGVGRRGSADGTIPATGVRHSAHQTEVRQ